MKEKSKAGAPSHEPTAHTKEIVKLHAAVGTPQEIIASIIEIDPKTLRKHYRRELDLSLAQANAQIGGKLYNKAMQGDTASIIFWLKTRAGFKETNAVDVYQNQGPAPTNPQDLTDEQIAEFILAHAENDGDGVADEKES